MIRVVNEARKRLGKDQGGQGGAVVVTSSMGGTNTGKLLNNLAHRA